MPGAIALLQPGDKVFDVFVFISIPASPSVPRKILLLWFPTNLKFTLPTMNLPFPALTRLYDI
jgi:hypothetical protein